MVLGKTVEELERTLSPSEISEWIALDVLELIGEDRADLRAATAMAFQASTRERRRKATDFLPALNPRFKRSEETLDVTDLDSFEAFAAAHNKRVADG